MNYNYAEPFDIQASRNVENNRQRIMIEAKYHQISPEVLSSMAIPTTPMTSQEIRTFCNNAERLQTEYHSRQIISGSTRKTTYIEETKPVSYSDGDDLKSQLLGLLVSVVCALPLILIIFCK